MEQRQGHVLEREESKLQAVEIQFLIEIVRKTWRDELEMHTLGETSGYKKYRTKLRVVD
jgi:hypothetical protein